MTSAPPAGDDPGANPGANPAPRLSGRQIAIQVVAMLIGLALLAWCASIAFGEKNREELARLRDARLAQVAPLLGLSLLSLAINGLVFWVALLPVRRLRLADVLSTNALCAFVGYVPFKVGFFLRVGIHARRDRVPVLTIGAWFAAVAATMLATIGALGVASRLDPGLGPRWYATAGGLLVAAFLAMVLFSRIFAGPSGLARWRGLIGRLKVGPLNRILASERYANLHAGTDLLSSPWCVGGAMALRVADIAIQAARVPVAAAILGHEVPFGHAFLIASTSFLTGIVSPAGPVGAREGAVTALCHALGIPNAEAFAVVALLVSATEAVAYGFGALMGIAWLGPTRLFSPRVTGTDRPYAQAPATSEAP